VESSNLKKTPSEVTICNEGFMEALEKCGATRVKVDIQKGVEKNDCVIFHLGDRYFAISSHRGGDILKGSYLTFTSGLIESLPKPAK
jgi:hypothetical protein